MPDTCQGDVQSGASGVGAPGGLSMSGRSPRLPGASVTSDAGSGGAVSETESSKGSKMRGSASEDMVPSVASSRDSGTAVSTAGVRSKTRVKTLDRWTNVSPASDKIK